MSTPTCAACAKPLAGIVLICDSVLFDDVGIRSCDARACSFECLRAHRVAVHGSIGVAREVRLPGAIRSTRITGTFKV